MYDLDSGEPVKILTTQQISTCMTSMLGGKKLAVGSTVGHIQIWDMHSFECENTLKIAGCVKYLLAIPFAHELISASVWEYKIWDTRSGQCLKTLDCNRRSFVRPLSFVHQIFLVKEAHLLVFNSIAEAGGVKMCDVRTGQCLNSFDTQIVNSQRVLDHAHTNRLLAFGFNAKVKLGVVTRHTHNYAHENIVSLLDKYVIL